MSKNAKSGKRRVSKYWFVLLALLIVNAIIITIVLNWLYGTLADYETHTPRQAILGYFTQLSEDDREAIMATASFVPDEQNSWDDYFEVLDKRFGDVQPDNVTWRQTISADLVEGEQMYSIYSGDEKLGTVVLTPSDTQPTGWSVRSDVDYLPGYTVQSLPQGVQVYQNGVALQVPASTDSVIINYERNGNPVEVDIFLTLSDEALIPLTTTPFETQATLGEPDFTATDWNGDPCDVAVDQDARTVTVTVPVEAASRDALAAHMEEVAHMYSDFVTYEYGAQGINMLLPYVYEGSSLYQDFKDYQAYWYLDYDSRTFSESSFADIVMHSDTSFTGRIDFTVTILRNGITHVFEPSYDMAFILVEDEWKLVGLHARRAVGSVADTEGEGSAAA